MFDIVLNTPLHVMFTSAVSVTLVGKDLLKVNIGYNSTTYMTAARKHLIRIYFKHNLNVKVAILKYNN